MALTEKIELLGKGVYKNIPDSLTLTAIPTLSELDYVGGEDFDKIMLEKIFPASIVEDINFGELLQIDYHWICRCLRILNYGPYYTTNRILCSECGETSNGEYQVNLNTIECLPLPENFVNSFTLSKDEFLDYKGDVTFKLPTIVEINTAYSDKAFTNPDGTINNKLARTCYMITSMNGKSGMAPIEIKKRIENEFSSADYIILTDRINEISDYGLRAGGTCQCPKCKSMNAVYLALVDDRFFRPTVGNLQKWRNDKDKRTV